MKFHQAMRLLHIGEAVRRDDWAKGCILLPRLQNCPQYMLSEIRAKGPGQKDRVVTSEWIAKQDDVIATDWSLVDTNDLLGLYLQSMLREREPAPAPLRDEPEISAAYVEVVHTDRRQEESRISADVLMAHFVAAPILISCLKSLKDTKIMPKSAVESINRALDAYDRVRADSPDGDVVCVINDPR